MVNNRIRYHAYTALALLLANGGLAKADVYVCGNDYGDAVTNCVINTPCPLGDGCSTEQTCFAVPEPECVGMTTSPSHSPTVTPDLYVCGVSYDDALSKCNSANDACANVTDTTAYCALAEDEIARSCFIVPHDACLSIAPTSAPVIDTATVAATTTSPTVATASASASPTASSSVASSTTGPTVSVKPTASTLGTTSPTMTTVVTSSAPISSDPATAELGTMAPSITTVTSAPTSLELEPIAAAVDTTATPTPALLYVCGSDYDDASVNYCGLAPCPLGDVSHRMCAQSLLLRNVREQSISHHVYYHSFLLLK
jgi:hypothetical protein